jgi:hypothetical protein
MSATNAPPPLVSRAPVREEIVLELRRHNSVLRVLVTDWPDGRRGASIGYLGLRRDSPRWRYIHLQLGEVERVAEALLRVGKEQP